MKTRTVKESPSVILSYLVNGHCLWHISTFFLSTFASLNSSMIPLLPKGSFKTIISVAASSSISFYYSLSWSFLSFPFCLWVSNQQWMKLLTPQVDPVYLSVLAVAKAPSLQIIICLTFQAPSPFFTVNVQAFTMPSQPRSQQPPSQLVSNILEGNRPPYLSSFNLPLLNLETDFCLYLS